MNPHEFFDYLRPWSKRKHRLLRKYLPPFIAKVAKATSDREIYCVDGFAGAASYDDGSEGSPLLIARFSDECAQWQNPVFLRLINVEADSRKEGIFSSLEGATAEWKEKGVVTNIHSDFRSALPEILRTIGRSPALFFIDPFGPTHLYFDDLRPIFLRDNRITELIINFDQDGLRRIVDAGSSERTNPKAAATNLENISKVIGSNGWKSQILGGNLTTLEAEAVLVREYMANIAKYGYDVVAYPIRDILESNPKYHFVYCTRHRDGIALMNDFIRDEEDLLYGNYVEEKLTLFSSEASLSNEIESRRLELTDLVKDVISRRQIVTRGQIRNELVPAKFGKFHSKDYNAVVQDLLKIGFIRETGGKTRINDQDSLRIVTIQ